jgi:hypothetical protein
VAAAEVAEVAEVAAEVAEVAEVAAEVAEVAKADPVSDLGQAPDWCPARRCSNHRKRSASSRRTPR